MFKTSAIPVSVQAAPMVVDVLTESHVWSRPGPAIWQAKRFAGRPHFYPIYRWRDLYSYSPLSLIRYKGRLRLNPRAVTAAKRADFVHTRPDEFVDLDLTRIGGVIRFRPELSDPEEVASRLATAMSEDSCAAERANPGTTNVVLCAGRDSLNLLLLPWRHATIALSAEPNYELVARFVAQNDLPYEVIRLRDDPQFDADAEILINCCRDNLVHCRWGAHLQEIAREFSDGVIFWKGQCGSPLQTLKWRRGSEYGRLVPEFLTQGWKALGSPFQWKIGALISRTRLIEMRFGAALWQRWAMWQGAHVGLLRELTGALVLSGYHGSATREVFRRVDYSRAIREDIRPRVGRYLAGRDIQYPATNPYPPISFHRQGLSRVELFLDRLQGLDVEIC